MYKKVLISVFALVAIVFTSNAQIFVGGNLGLGFSGGKTSSGSTSVDAPKTVAFSLMPKVGYYLNDDLAVGIEVGLLTGIEKEKYGETEVKTVLTGWGVGFFGRYNVVGTEKLSLLLEGSINIGGMKTKYSSGSTSYDIAPTTAFGIGVLPVVSYSLTDRLSIEASCDFLRLGFRSTTVKDPDDTNYKKKNYDFGLGVNTVGFNMLGLEEYLGASSLFKLGLTFKF